MNGARDTYLPEIWSDQRSTQQYLTVSVKGSCVVVVRFFYLFLVSLLT